MVLGLESELAYAFVGHDSQRPAGDNEIMALLGCMGMVCDAPTRWVEKRLHLASGAQLYNDLTHPELATSECATPAQLVHQDLGLRMLLGQTLEEMRRGLDDSALPTVYLHSAGVGSSVHVSYGCHENYSSTTDPSSDAMRALLAHLVTRIVYTGAGRSTTSRTIASR